MERLYVSEKKLKKLPLYYDIKTSEADILDYSEKEIIKYFHLINENKVYTLSEMERQEEDLKAIKELLIFKKIVIVHSKMKGILLEKGYSTNFDLYAKENENVRFNDLILILQNIGKLLQKLQCFREQEKKLQTFFIGDFHEGNILVDKETKKIQICDIDSCKIGNNKPFPNKYLQFCCTGYYVLQNLSKKYPLLNGHFVPNHNSDLYCYISIIMKTLFNLDIRYFNITNFFKKLYVLREQGLPEPLFQIFLNIYSPVENKNPYKLLDSIPNTFERNLKR